MGKKKNVILPPLLPQQDDEAEISDEDLKFVENNPEYAGFVSHLDTESINRYVSRVADLKEDEVEALYEKRRKSKKREEDENEKKKEVKHVDSLPVRALDGTLYYRTFSETASKADDGGDGEGDADADKGMVKLTKTEKRAKIKKSRKEAKKQGKELQSNEEVEQTPQAAVLAEVKEDLTAEEAFESKKHKLAELGMTLLADPEANIKTLKEMIEYFKDDNDTIVRLALLSVLAVFKDIIPGYRIRLPTEKEMEMKVSKEVKKMRYYESTLLSGYKAYLLKLVSLEKKPRFQHVAIRCICTLLEAVPHFNFRESLLDVVVQNMGSSDDVARKVCCSTIKSLFVNEGKHGGELTVEAVRLIANLVKAHNCQLLPDSVEVFMSLSIDEDLVKAKEPEKDNKSKSKNKKRKFVEEPNKSQENDKKRKKKEIISKMRKEVVDDYKSVAFAPDVAELKQWQSDTLSAVFETYFRILKQTMLSVTRSPDSDGTDTPVDHPLLAPCLNGLGKFSHLLDLDYIGDLINYLKRLAGGGRSSDISNKFAKGLSVSERLQCCIVAFKVMRNNLDALNVDLQCFFIELYNLIVEYRPGRDRGEVLAEAFKIMLCDDRQHDMQKAAAFIKRLATFSLCFQSAECMSALVTLRHLLQRNVKCRNLLENDAGGGSVSGSVAMYQPYVTDPNLSGALASVLWELNLLARHYHPTVSTMASNISVISTAHNQVYLSTTTPQQAFRDMSLEHEAFNPKYESRKSSKKSKRGTSASQLSSVDEKTFAVASKEVLEEKLSHHFTVLRDLKMNRKLKADLDRTNSALQSYEEYKKKKKRTGRSNSKKLRKVS